ncbi:uncharacterized protein NESG_00773 [Nematocida ausubeli]|uniref:Uncharacterized protein n=1 Tax=Nematocida ausubeli (strain ATCC PRA-371 / ERTm2) TaxID=1913371 RepID=A0A086J3A4_NEMA1|nr:uncharacterized protein NESG_00773 [Nematocida ausubeli]KFG26622.1 hypothetical protein NESG_00773 [Nematocida ausubeli]
MKIENIQETSSTARRESRSRIQAVTSFIWKGPIIAAKKVAKGATFAVKGTSSIVKKGYRMVRNVIPHKVRSTVGRSTKKVKRIAARAARRVFPCVGRRRSSAAPALDVQRSAVALGISEYLAGLYTWAIFKAYCLNWMEMQFILSTLCDIQNSLLRVAELTPAYASEISIALLLSGINCRLEKQYRTIEDLLVDLFLRRQWLLNQAASTVKNEYFLSQEKNVLAYSFSFLCSIIEVQVCIGSFLAELESIPNACACLQENFNLWKTRPEGLFTLLLENRQVTLIKACKPLIDALHSDVSIVQLPIQENTTEALIIFKEKPAVVFEAPVSEDISCKLPVPVVCAVESADVVAGTLESTPSEPSTQITEAAVNTLPESTTQQAEATGSPSSLPLTMEEISKRHREMCQQKNKQKKEVTLSKGSQRYLKKCLKKAEKNKK